MDYEDRVRRGTAAASALSREVLADLDEQSGGIGWWRDHVGWKHSALIGEYLLASGSGVSTALIKASMAIKQYKETEYAQNDALRRAWMAQASVTGARELARAFPDLGDAGRRRDVLLPLWSEVTFTSLAQALDRLAAVVVIVGGIGVKVLTTDWGHLADLAKTAARNVAPQDVRQQLTGKLAPPGTVGRTRQNELLDLTRSWQEYGPTDWLPWLLKSRNTATHRAERLAWIRMRAGKQGPEGYIRSFWSQPDWADTESMLRSSRGSHTLTLLLPQEPLDILEGLRGSVVEFTTAILEAAKALWIQRREDPTLLVQPGRIWPNIETTAPLDFPGYGRPAKIVTKDAQINVNPDTARRFKAARLLEQDLHYWRE